MKIEFFNVEKRNFYIAKKNKLDIKRQSKKQIREDAMFVKYYGMSAFLELFPEAKGLGVSWHRELIRELISLEEKYLADQIQGFYIANLASRHKKAHGELRRYLDNLRKR